MLPEVICAEKLFALVTFTKLVDCCEMIAAGNPILGWKIGELFTTVSAYIEFSRHTRLLWWGMIGIGIRRNSIARMEGSLVVAV